MNKLFLISCHYEQLISGSYKKVLSYPILKYMKKGSSWICKAWTSISHYNISIQLSKITIPASLYPHDRSIMDEVILYIPDKDIVKVNKYRLYLRLFHIGDISKVTDYSLISSPVKIKIRNQVNYNLQ